MKDIVINRAMRKIVGLLNRQGVHVRTQPDGAVILTPAQNADHARCADAAMDFQPEALQKISNLGCRTFFTEPQFRVLMDIAAPSLHFFL